jgi:N-acetylneuraminate synthase
MGTTVATTSVALGACVIEKHFTLSRADKGPDSEFSLEPHELRLPKPKGQYFLCN